MSKIIFFDFDGTIVDCQKFQISRLKNVFNHFGIDTSDIDFLTLIGPPLYNTFAKYMGKAKAHEVLDYYNASFDPQKINNIFLFDGIKQMLVDLNKQGHKVCLTSLQFESVVFAELDYLGIKNCFAKVYCDDVKKAYKTKIDLVADVIKTQKYNKHDIVLVGDTDNDVFAGTANKLFTVAVSWGYGNVDNAKVDAVVKTPQELFEIIENIN